LIKSRIQPTNGARFLFFFFFFFFFFRSSVHKGDVPESTTEMSDHEKDARDFPIVLASNRGPNLLHPFYARRIFWRWPKTDQERKFERRMQFFADR
jgi:hypothetical protein